MRKSLKKEVKRQTFHMTLGVILASLILVLGYAYSVYAFAIVMGLGLVAMAKSDKGVLEKFLKIFGREHETSGQGAFYFFAGAFITLFLFSEKAVPALLVLAFSDSASTIFGKLLPKKIVFGEKTLAGSTAFFLTALIILSFFTSPLLAVFIALTATLVELFGFGIDDNVTIPFTVGFLLFILV